MRANCPALTNPPNHQCSAIPDVVARKQARAPRGGYRVARTTGASGLWCRRGDLSMCTLALAALSAMTAVNKPPSFVFMMLDDVGWAVRVCAFSHAHTCCDAPGALAKGRACPLITSGNC